MAHKIPAEESDKIKEAFIKNIKNDFKKIKVYIDKLNYDIQFCFELEELLEENIKLNNDHLFTVRYGLDGALKRIKEDAFYL